VRQGQGIFAGPSGQASVKDMKSWGINALRLPLNEASLNGESYVDPGYAGVNYRNAITSYVKLLNSAAAMAKAAIRQLGQASGALV